MLQFMPNARCEGETTADEIVATMIEDAESTLTRLRAG